MRVLACVRVCVCSALLPAGASTDALGACARACACAWAALVTAILVGVMHPAVLVVAAALAATMVSVSLLPQGHTLLRFSYMREAHRVLGCVVAAREPPPYLLVGDASHTIDPLGMLELLRRRCSRIVVCDATRDWSSCGVATHGCTQCVHAHAHAPGLSGENGGGCGCLDDGCWVLLRVLERARKEVCMFILYIYIYVHSVHMHCTYTV